MSKHKFLIGTRKDQSKVLINLDHISCVMENGSNADTFLDEKKACIVLQGGTTVCIEETYDEVVDSIYRISSMPYFKSS